MNLWYELQKQLEIVKTQEMALRKKIFAAHYPNPVEGTNTVPLTDGWVLKANYPITRKVDKALLSNHVARLRTLGIAMDDLIDYKPELVLPFYRRLTDEQMKAFDEILIIKPGSPALEIVLPKSAAKK
jgi:hypothetical protein